MIILAALLLAHSWYPAECCSDRDCRPVEEKIYRDGKTFVRGSGMLLEVPTGFLIRPSQDQKEHFCWELRAGELKLRCYFAPGNV